MDSRLDSSRTHYLQAMRSSLDNKIGLALGRDGPINAFLSLMFATTHPDNPREALTLEEALIAYTVRGAFAEFMEAEKGMIAVGLLADLAVLSQDIFKIPSGQLQATERILTFLMAKLCSTKRF